MEVEAKATAKTFLEDDAKAKADAIEEANRKKMPGTGRDAEKTAQPSMALDALAHLTNRSLHGEDNRISLMASEKAAKNVGLFSLG